MNVKLVTGSVWWVVELQSLWQMKRTPEHEYEVINNYRYMIHIVNERSKTNLKVDDYGRFLDLFVSYGAWIGGFVHTRKVLVIDGTHLSVKYGEVLLSAMAQNTRNHIFSVAFCVVSSEYDTSYQFFLDNCSTLFPILMSCA